MNSYKKEYFSKEVKNISESNLKACRGRYDAKIRLRLADNKLVIRNLKKPDLTAKESNTDIIHTVTLYEAERPDLIALKYYDDARLYWVILGANNLKEKAELTNGLIIRIPTISSIYGNDGLISR